MIAWLLLGLGCMQAPDQPSHLWVGGGWVHNDPTVSGRPVGGKNKQKRWFTTEADNPNTTWQKAQNADCAALFHIPLGDVDRHIALGGSAPDTVLAWSNRGDVLAIGTFLGELILVDGWAGTVLHREKLAETMVKQVAWSEDDRTIYVGEQSPDGSIVALDAQSLNEQWRLNLSDWIEHSPLPPGDLYGAYTLPAAYGLDVLPDGSLFVTGTHAWNDRHGTRHNQSILLKLAPNGKVQAQWPEEPIDAVFFRPRIKNGLALLPTSKSSEGPPPPEAPVGGILLFDTQAFKPIHSFAVPPLSPWFNQAFIWEAADIREESLFLGLTDGRAQIWTHGGELIQNLPSSTPIMAGKVPVVASIGTGFFLDENPVYQISTTHIPFGTAAAALSPPAPHPQENSLIYSSPSGELLWSWSGPHQLQGISRSAQKNRIIVGAGARTSDSRRDLFGALTFVFPDDDNDTATPQLERFCRTESPVFFRATSTVDGRIAVTEHPVQHGDLPAHGRYQATVFR